MQLCKLLSEMPIDLHKLVANYLRKIHTSQYLKAISWGGNSSVKAIQTCATGAISWEVGGGEGRGNSSVKVIQTCATGAISWEGNGRGGKERGNSSVKVIQTCATG